MNIGFLQFGGRGDMLMATAVLEEVRMRHPHDCITWMCLDCYRDVIDGHPMIDSYIAWPQVPDIPRQRQELYRWDEMKDYAHRTFDEVVIPQHYPDHYFTNTRHGTHLIDQMFLNAEMSPVYPRRLTSPRRDTNVECDIAVNTKGVSQGSIWDARKWDEFFALCDAKGWRVVDGDIAGVGWQQWATVIDKARVYVGLDSGGTWLAATTDTPQVVLRSGRNDNPPWLTSFSAAMVKPTRNFEEMVDPSPKDVYHAVKAFMLR